MKTGHVDLIPTVVWISKRNPRLKMSSIYANKIQHTDAVVSSGNIAETMAHILAAIAQ